MIFDLYKIAYLLNTNYYGEAPDKRRLKYIFRVRFNLWKTPKNGEENKKEKLE